MFLGMLLGDATSSIVVAMEGCKDVAVDFCSLAVNGRKRDSSSSSDKEGISDLEEDVKGTAGSTTGAELSFLMSTEPF